MEFARDTIEVLRPNQLSACEAETPLLSLREIVIESILSSRNCHLIIQLYDYCKNIAHQEDAASLAKEFIADKFAFFIERYLCIA